MGLMQSWIAAQGSGRVVLRVLPIVVAMMHAQSVLGFEGSLTVVPFEPASTLDAYVPLQDMDMQKTVIDFVDSGILTGKKQPVFQQPKLILAAPQQQKTALSLPSETSAAEESTKVAPTKVSPFRKWVKPQIGSAAKPDTKPAPAKPAPQVARRSSRPTSPKLAPAKQLPKPAPKKDTAVASDLSNIPQTPSYPEPAADSARSAPPAKNLPPLTTSQQNLRKKIRNVLTHYYNRPLNTRDRSPWEIMHAMLSFEAHSKVLQGGPKGKPITAVGWLCYNQACKRRTLMYVNDDGELSVRVGPALQGHRGQLLAMLAQSRINVNYPMLVEDNELKVADLIAMEKRTCYPRTELTFKLIALMHYLDSDAKWVNDQGMEWGIPRLISEELRQPVRGAACGGTHRLSGLTLAYKTREKRGEPVDGQYLKAKKFVTRYQQYAYRLQNRDGSFSTEWFRGPGNENDIDRKLKTTGHILEWLLYASSEKELKHWRTTKAVNYLANSMNRNRYKDWEAGPLGHAIHALLVYDRLVFSPYDPPEHSTIAAKLSHPSQTKRNR